MKRWISLFSQTGSELEQISKKLGRYPDYVICNRNHFEGINQELLKHTILLGVPQKPSVGDYYKAIGDRKDTIVTLHGYLRIIPPEICNDYEIYNGHPGDIVQYPELKGFNPQKKALELKLPTTGTVIHRVTAEVDCGEIVSRAPYTITPTDTLDSLTNNIKGLSIDIWVTLLRKLL